MADRPGRGATILEAADALLPEGRETMRVLTSAEVAAIGPTEAAAYIARRQVAGVSNATINRELAVLIRMLRLAYEHGKLLRLPVIRKLKESGPRQGFFERAQYEAVRKQLGPDLQVAVAIAYTFGWRMQSEVLALERRQLDLEAGILRLEPGTTKNDEGRLVYLPSNLKAQLAAQVDRVRGLERKLERVIPYLFPHLRGPWKGTRRRDFRKAWAEATTKAGCPGRLRHDFRRTAVRNLVNAGVPERVAMKVTGHKTRACLTGTTSSARATSRTWPVGWRARFRARRGVGPLTRVPQVARITDTDD